MPQVVAVPRCCHLLGDSAVMRSTLPASPILSSPFLRSISNSQGSRHRGIHHAFNHAKEPAIFQNSLVKTLEVHRAANRASLIRKVINQSDLQEKSSSIALPENNSIQTAQNEASDVDPGEQCLKSPRLRRETKREVKGLLKKPRRLGLEAPMYRSISWKVDARNGRPEQHPWLELSNKVFSDGMSQLDAEIRALEEYLAPTPQEEARIGQIVSDITKMLDGCLPNPLEVIGSRRTGFAMSHSNLDVFLPVQDSVRPLNSIRKPSATRPKMLQAYSELLRSVERTIRQVPTDNSSRIHVLGTRHCVLSALHQPTGLHLQFHCGEDLPASIEYTRDFRAEYPLLRPLYMTVRLMLETQSLFGSNMSSITSDALIMLIASFLKMNHGRFRRTDGPGKPLLAFLHAYGIEVDLLSTGVAVDPPALFSVNSVKETSKFYSDNLDEMPAHIRGQRALIKMKRKAATKHNSHLATQLCLQDPANFMNGLGRSCYRVPELQNAFASAYNKLNLSLDLWSPSQSCTSKNSLLGCILNANFDDFDKRRKYVVSAKCHT